MISNRNEIESCYDRFITAWLRASKSPAALVPPPAARCIVAIPRRRVPCTLQHAPSANPVSRVSDLRVNLILQGNWSLPTVHKGKTPIRGVALLTGGFDCASFAQGLRTQTHPPVRQHPYYGGYPCEMCTVGRDQLPLSHKQTPSTLAQASILGL